MVDYEARLQRVIHYIHDNPAADLSLDTLADVAAMSRFHWHRVFRAMTGETCAAAVKRIRMHQAAHMLVSGTDPISAIAAAVGYPQVASFSRAFSDIYHMAPGRFRTEGRITPQLVAVKTQEKHMHDVTIRDVPAKRLAALSHTGPYTEIGRAFQSLFATIAARGYFDRIGKGVGVYFDDPMQTPPDALRSVAGVELNDGVAPPEGVEAYDIPAGRAAVMTFTGPYSGLPAAWDALYGSWLAQSGEVPGDAPSYEVYLNDPTDTPPEALITELVLPLK